MDRLVRYCNHPQHSVETSHAGPDYWMTPKLRCECEGPGGMSQLREQDSEHGSCVEVQVAALERWLATHRAPERCRKRGKRIA